MQSDISKEEFIAKQQAELDEVIAELERFRDQLSPTAIHGIEWVIDEKKRFINFAISDQRVRPES